MGTGERNGQPMVCVRSSAPNASSALAARAALAHGSDPATIRGRREAVRRRNGLGLADTSSCSGPDDQNSVLRAEHLAGRAA